MKTLYKDREGNRLVLTRNQIYAKNSKGKVVNIQGLNTMINKARRAGKFSGRRVKHRK